MNTYRQPKDRQGRHSLLLEPIPGRVIPVRGNRTDLILYCITAVVFVTALVAIIAGFRLHVFHP